MHDSPATHHFDDQTVRQLLEISRLLAAPVELRQLLTMVIDVGRSVLQSDRGSVFLYDEKTRELYTTVATGADEIRFSIDHGIAGECARHRGIINVPDCYADPRFNKAIDKQTGYHTRCLITVPLIGLDDQLVGVMQLLNADKGHYDDYDEAVATALASQAAIGLQKALLLEERMVKLKLEADLDLARQIQYNVLPRSIPPCRGYDIATFSRPADQTGGDMYDLVKIETDAPPEQQPMFIMLADATGHGIGPALSVSNCRSMFRVGLKFNADFEQLITHVNDQLCDDLAANRFITAFLGLLDPAVHHVRYHALGQGPLMHFHHADQSFDWLSASTVPMGIMAGTPLIEPAPLELQPGDIVGLLTDGFYEYQNPRDEQFDTPGVSEVIVQHQHRTADEIIAALVEAVGAFAQGTTQADDLTAIIIKRSE